MGVRIPRITLNADFGEDAAFGELSLLSVGYGLHQAWMYATMFGSSSVFGTQAYVSGMFGSHVSLPYVASIIAYCICLFMIAATNQRFLERYVSKSTMALGALLATAGTLLLLMTADGNTALEIASGIVTGLGSSVLVLSWGVAYARCDSASIVLNTGMAISISIAVYAFGLHFLPFPLAGCFTAIIPLLELAILWRKTPAPFSERNDVPIFKPLPVNHAKFVVRFGVPVFVFGVALGMLRQTSIQYIVPAANSTDQMIMLLAAGCATVLILITIVALGGGGRWNRFFRPLVPFIAVTALLLPFSESGDDTLSNFVLMAGYLCFEALMWMFFSEISQRFRLSPLFVFGVGRGFLAAAILLGSLFPVMAASWVDVLPFGEETIVIAVLLTMVVAYALLPREREIEAIVAPCPLVRAVSSSLEEGTATAVAGTGSGTVAVVGAGTATTTGAGAASGAGMAAEIGMLTTPTAASTPPMSHAGANGSLASAAPSEARMAMENSNRSTGTPTNDTSNERRMGRFRAKCETVANTYLLSQRETEVMFFLAKGHNAAYIQEKLYISEGTAKTHIRHIYRKVNIHTQQELMRLVESADPTE